MHNRTIRSLLVHIFLIIDSVLFTTAARFGDRHDGFTSSGYDFESSSGLTMPKHVLEMGTFLEGVYDTMALAGNTFSFCGKCDV